MVLVKLFVFIFVFFGIMFTIGSESPVQSVVWGLATGIGLLLLAS